VTRPNRFTTPATIMSATVSSTRGFSLWNLFPRFGGRHGQGYPDLIYRADGKTGSFGISQRLGSQPLKADNDHPTCPHGEEVHIQTAEKCEPETNQRIKSTHQSVELLIKPNLQAHQNHLNINQTNPNQQSSSKSES